MKFENCTLFFLLTCSSVFALGNKYSPQISSLKSISFPKKLGILATSYFKSSSQKGIKLKWADLFAPDDLPLIDFTYVDFRSVLTQSMKVPIDIPIPEFNYNYPIYLNESGSVFNWTITLTSGETQIIGQKNTTSLNEVTPTTFKNIFRVPFFLWKSPKAGIQLYDNNNDEYFRAQNISYTIQNLTLNTSANYEFVPEIGIQISSLSIEYDLGYLGYSVGDFIYGYLDGHTTYPGVEEDLTEVIFYAWEYNQADYIAGLEFRINCFLGVNVSFKKIQSGSRNNPERCEVSDEEMYISPDYYKMNVLQLFETIGLGSMNTS